MHGYNLVAVYPTLEEARRVSDRLLAEGVNPADVRLTDAAMTPGAGDVATTRATSEVPARAASRGRFFRLAFRQRRAGIRPRSLQHIPERKPGRGVGARGRSAMA